MLPLKNKRKSFLSLVLAAACLLGCADKKIGKDEAIRTAKEAYIYGLPIVLTDLTRLGSGRPENEFHHSHAFPDHTFRMVVRPNNDTYYSSAFLDLGKEPIVLHIPDTKDRYAVIPLMDAWTNVFASFGKRNTGTKSQTYVVTGPTWKGTLPDSIAQVKAPTDLVWIIGRIQVNSPEDGKHFVIPLQEGLTLTPLSQWGRDSVATTPSKPAATYAVEASSVVKALKYKEVNVLEALKKLSIEEYFTYLNELLVKNPGLEADKELLERLAKIGIKPSRKFDLAAFDEEAQQELKKVPGQVLASLDSARSVLTGKQEGKPDGTLGHYGTNYQKRAAVAYFGLGALGPEEAVYLGYRTDADNQPLHGDQPYVIHFEPGKTPPAQAFWSITLYDKDGYLTENSIRRYAIGDRNNLQLNKDGSLDIYVQHDSPGKTKETNWLPAPKDIFNLSVRIYWPTDDYLKNGSWTKPPIKKLTL